MSRAVYVFTEKSTDQVVDQIEFELFDNPGVKAWQYAVMLNDPFRICFKRNIVSFSKWSPADIDQQYQKLVDSVNALNNTKYLWNQAIPEAFDKVNQDFFNQLHRHFTDSCYDIWDHRSQNFDNLEINENLQNLNNLIHHLEKYVANDTKLKYCDQGKEIGLRSQGTELGYDMYPFRRYHSYEHADLILDGYILGKTLMESFVCEDNPTSWDTNGHMRTNGGAIVLLDQVRYDVYNSENFEYWLTSHGAGKHNKLADFSLGNFVSGHRNKLLSLEQHLHNFSVRLYIQQ
jgi:hypothetical protein